MCLKNCNNQDVKDMTNLKCEIGRLYKLIGELNQKIDSIRNPEKSAPKEARDSNDLPWFANKSPEEIAIEILKASKYIFDKNIEISYQPAGDGKTFGLAFEFKIRHTDANSSIIAVESFYCPICLNLEQTVARFDGLCDQMHAIRLRHEDEHKNNEETRREEQQNLAAFRHLLKDIVVEVLGKEKAEHVEKAKKAKKGGK